MFVVVLVRPKQVQIYLRIVCNKPINYLIKRMKKKTIIKKKQYPLSFVQFYTYCQRCVYVDMKLQKIVKFSKLYLSK